jgi:hypothetical protein
MLSAGGTTAMDREDRVPDTITIREHHSRELRTSSADLHCTCRTRRSMTTPPAVRNVQQALAGAGFPEGCLRVENLTRDSELGGCLGAVGGGAIIAAAIAAFVSSASLRTVLPIIAAAALCLGAIAWFFFRSTQCAFAVTCADAKAVERALDIIAKVGGVAVTSTDWRYEVDSTALGDWAVKCIERANARADRVARALGVRVVGVFSYEESFELPQRHYSPEGSMPRAMSTRGRSSANELEEEPSSAAPVLAGSERSGAEITVRYRVADYAPRTKA